MNSREKGKRGERQWRDELRAQGFAARRGQQFSGGTESPDVICDDIPWAHFEVKAVERLNIEDAMEQARRDCREEARKGAKGGWKVPIVAHRRNFRPWLVTMEATTFFRLLGGDVPPKERVDGGGLRVESGKTEDDAIRRDFTEGNKENEEGKTSHGATRMNTDFTGGNGENGEETRETSEIRERGLTAESAKNAEGETTDYTEYAGEK